MRNAIPALFALADVETSADAPVVVRCAAY